MEMKAYGDIAQLSKRFGAHVRQLRARLNLTQAEVALRAGVSQGHISAIERNDAFPNDLNALAQALEVSLYDLVLQPQGLIDPVEQALKEAPLLSAEQRSALLVIYGSFTGRESASMVLETMEMEALQRRTSAQQEANENVGSDQ